MRPPLRLLFAAMAVLVAAAVGLAVFLPWKAKVSRDRRADLVVMARKSLEEGKTAEVLATVDKVRPLLPPGERDGELDQMEVKAAAAGRDFPRLLRLQEARPELVAENEEASYWMARMLGTLGREDAANRLIDIWRQRDGKHPEWWLFLRADRLMADGRMEEARVLIEGQTFSGRAEAGRLLRLAMLSMQAPETARKHLEAAYAADPTYPETRIFRARILEGVGQVQRARLEYAAAVAAAPGDPLMAHEFALFCQRQGLWSEAVRVWEALGGDMRYDVMALPAYFWREVALGRTEKADPRPIRGGSADLAKSLSERLETTYPTPDWFRPWPAAERQPEAWWLGLLGLLQHNRPADALDLLENPSLRAVAWNPSMAQALRVVLRWKLQEKSPVAGDLAAIAPDHPAPLFRELAAWSRRDTDAANNEPAPELASILASPEVFSAVLAAGGWMEASVRFLPENQPLPSTPLSHAYALAVALRDARGHDAMLARWPQSESPEPALALLRAESLLQAGRRDEGVTALDALAQGTGDPAIRAAWVLATLALAENQIDAAEKRVRETPALAAHALGQSLSARIAVVKGDYARADALYAAMQPAGEDALAWLARRAFEAKRWDEAERHTVALLEMHPDNLTLLRNLERIRAARNP